MADLNGVYEQDDKPSAGFDPLPAGTYLACITESERKDTSKGDGWFLKLVFEILEGTFKGRKVFANLNLGNKSDQAVGIARAEFAAIRKAVGIAAPKDSVELHDLPLAIGVKCTKRQDTGDIQNKIVSYKPKSEFKAPAVPSVTPGKPAGNAPWKKS